MQGILDWLQKTETNTVFADSFATPGYTSAEWSKLHSVAETGQVRWDGSAALTQQADVAAASTAGGQIVLSFGVRHGEDRPGQEQGVALLRRIALQPTTAKNLHDMLARMIAEVAATKPPG